ncbi:hypothetical protein FA95DRAFT_1576359 [Auriscalpium vulgare]|uniref:Uncharacterized protein n=1 Tax=Auriscalpium vulgare TaxID=40419 RepID=A0ACB8RB89_9AGAM|nr:hypothetical protein FA95DRAFT_1576359 [Auriscalpium vulgare]
MHSLLGICRRRPSKWESCQSAQVSDFSTVVIISYRGSFSIHSMSQHLSDHSSRHYHGQQTHFEVPFAGSRRPFSPVRDSILNSSSAKIMRNVGNNTRTQSLGAGRNVGRGPDGGVVTDKPDVSTRIAHMPGYVSANISAPSQVQCASHVFPATQSTPADVYCTMPGSTPTQVWSTPSSAPIATRRSNDSIVPHWSTATTSGGSRPYPANWGFARAHDPRCTPVQGDVRSGTMAPLARGSAGPPRKQRFAYGRPVQFQPRPVQQRARGQDRANGGKDSPRDWMDVMKGNGSGRKLFKKFETPVWNGIQFSPPGAMTFLRDLSEKHAKATAARVLASFLGGKNKATVTAVDIVELM